MQALRTKMTFGLKNSADLINTLSDGATPFWRGNLRRSKSVKVSSWNKVQAVTGDSITRDYLAYQYDNELRHKGNRLDTYTSFSEGAANNSGSGEKAQYQRGYNDQKDSTPKSTAKWYERVIHDEQMMNQVKSVFRNSFRNG